MKINVHAGHNPDGKTACGAAGLIRESTEARKVKEELIRILRQSGHTVYDCTVSNGKNQTDILQKITAKCNAHKADLDISIHFNAGAGDPKGNGKTTGTEIYVYSKSSKSYPYAQRVQDAICQLGFKNRGVKINPSLYILRKTAAPAMLIECCFVDDKDDVKQYSFQTMAAAIAEGITGTQKHICPYKRPSKSVKPSSASHDIKWLQWQLNDKSQAGLEIDGSYGAKTQSALLRYWKQLGWNKDGKDNGLTAGQKTIASLSNES